MTDKECLFCKIIAKQIPGKIIREDDTTLAFLDIMPRAAGHTIVTSKHHAATLLELPPEYRSDLFSAVAAIDKLLVEKMTPDGMTIGMNQGAASGQEVGHLHVHLLPRWNGDGGGAIQSVVSRPSELSLDDMVKKITE